MEPQLRIGTDVGYKSHRVAIAAPDGEILKEFDIYHSSAGFDHFFYPSSTVPAGSDSGNALLKGSKF